MKPYRQSGLLNRIIRRTAATRVMAKIYGVIQQPLDRLVYRLSRGRTTASSFLAGVKITMLTTTGAKSGKQRTVPVLGLPDGEDLILIASNFGRPSNPSWLHNLRAHPRARVTFDGTTRELVARELTDAERDRCYAWGEAVYPGFTRYTAWASNRKIPVLRLSAESE